MAKRSRVMSSAARIVPSVPLRCQICAQHTAGKYCPPCADLLDRLNWLGRLFEALRCEADDEGLEDRLERYEWRAARGLSLFEDPDAGARMAQEPQGDEA